MPISRNRAGRDQRTPALRGQVEPQQVDGAGTVRAFHAQADVVAVAIRVFELRDHLTRHQSPHGGCDRTQVEPQIARGIAVQCDAHLGLRLLFAGVHVHGAGDLCGYRHHLFRERRQGPEFGAPHADLNRFLAAPDLVRFFNRRTYRAEPRQLAPDFRFDEAVVLAYLARRKPYENVALVDRLGGVAADRRIRVSHRGIAPDLGFQFPCDLRGPVQADARRRLVGQLEVAPDSDI